MELENKLGLKGKTIKLDNNTAITIVNENVNRLLRRLEIDVYIDHIQGGTPSRSFLRGSIAKIYGVPEEVVIVKNVISSYGRGASEAHVHIYTDIDQVRRIEHKYILKRNNINVAK